MPAVATAQADRTIAPEEIDAYVAEFQQDPVIPPVVDGVGGVTDAELAAYHDLVRATHAAGDPETEQVPGEMWSDTVGLPTGVDKTDADAAEIAIATEQDTLPNIDTLETLGTLDSMAMAPTSTHCKTFLFSPHQVCGAILERYEARGGQFGWLMHPVEPMYLNPDGVGYRQMFRNGFIYWHPATGAHAVTTRSAVVWDRHGWEQGWLGYPLGGEVPVKGTTPIDGELHGWVQIFQGGRIYRSPLQQVASINGLILDKWLQLGGPDSDLGFPIADEARTADEVGRFSVFQAGSIYWHPNHGAHPVSGAIGMIWLKERAEAGRYGYPLADEAIDSDGNIYQTFTFGEINLASYFQSDEVTLVGEQVLSQDYVTFVTEVLGIDLPPSFASSSSDMELLAQRTAQYYPPQNSTFRHNLRDLRVVSPILIPEEYEYNLSHPEKTLHDFCSYSQDLWGEDSVRANPSNIVADFRGPCAVHDMCYDDDRVYESRVPKCDIPFRSELKQTCKVAYSPLANLTSRGNCMATADGMYTIVKRVQAFKHRD